MPKPSNYDDFSSAIVSFLTKVDRKQNKAIVVEVCKNYTKDALQMRTERLAVVAFYDERGRFLETKFKVLHLDTYFTNAGQWDSHLFGKNGARTSYLEGMHFDFATKQVSGAGVSPLTPHLPQISATLQKVFRHLLATTQDHFEAFSSRWIKHYRLHKLLFDKHGLEFLTKLAQKAELLSMLEGIQVPSLYSATPVNLEQVSTYEQLAYQHRHKPTKAYEQFQKLIIELGLSSDLFFALPFNPDNGHLYSAEECHALKGEIKIELARLVQSVLHAPEYQAKLPLLLQKLSHPHFAKLKKMIIKQNDAPKFDDQYILLFPLNVGQLEQFVRDVTLPGSAICSIS